MIFDTTNLDNQIAELQKERDRKTTLNIAVTQALATLADIIDELDESAIAILKAEVMELFTDGKLLSLVPQDLEAPTTAPAGKLEPQPETISDRVSQGKQEYYQLVPTSNPAVAYLRRGDGQLGHVYIGGMSQARLQAWAAWVYRDRVRPDGHLGVPLSVHSSRCLDAPTVREAKRLSNWQYEIKLSPLPLDYLRELIAMDYTRYPSTISPIEVLAA